MAISTAMANYILDYNFGQTAYVVPNTLYLALFTTAPGNNGSGYVEISGGNYARVSVTNNNKSVWNTASAGVLSNTSQLTFPESSATWGTVVAVGLFDVQTVNTGAALYFENLTTPKTIQAQTTVIFSSGALSISMTNT